MSNIINLEEYKDKIKDKGGFAPVTVSDQRERILLQRQEIMEQRELINIMLSLASGKFIKHPKVNYIKTTEFTLNTEKGMIVVDGELINHNKIQVKCNSKNLLQLR